MTYFIADDAKSPGGYAFAAALVVLTVVSWIMIGKSVLTIHDEGIRRTSAFGPLRLTLRDIQWKAKDPVPLGELMSADIAGQHLRIRKKGKMLSLVTVRSDKVPNVLLLLETMERLGVGAGAAPVVDPLARVRV